MAEIEEPAFTIENWYDSGRVVRQPLMKDDSSKVKSLYLVSGSCQCVSGGGRSGTSSATGSSIRHDDSPHVIGDGYTRLP